MKQPIRSILAAALGLAMVQLAFAEKVSGGPQGGRLLEATPAKAEFLVTQEKKVAVVFYDQAMKPTSLGTQQVTVTAEAPGGRAVLDMDPTTNGFISRQSVPDGAPYRVVVQVRAAPGEKPQNFRIDLNLSMCGECSRLEYACVCEGH